jgi:tryptophan 7-halogenase
VDSLIRKIVIVGGGSAGWLTAGVLAAEHPRLQVTLLESPDTPPVGVGEGTWPSMRDTLRRIGVGETDFIRQCDAAFKQGSRFDGWLDGRPGDHYYHPFFLPHGYGDANLAAAWQRHGGAPFADLVSCQPHLCAQGRAPKQVVTPEYAAVANYGYHLDAGKFGQFLRRHCVDRLGVRHVLDHVVAVRAHENEDIAAVSTREHGDIEGDLFIDCSGMRSLLLGQHYGVPFLSQKHILFNDTALAVQVRHARADSPIASQTISTAESSGWIWDVGLPERRGVGYVYSSAHSSDEEAARALEAYIARTGGGEPAGTPRKIAFDPGYRAHFWHRNCLAIGLSAGFIEPLEASALALVELSAGMLADDLPVTRAAMDIVARRFNEAFAYRWERVIDFLKLHYVLSRRDDSEYWRAHRAPSSVPARLDELLQLWRHRPPSRNDLGRIEEVFPAASYQYVLYGMGFRCEFEGRASDNAQLAEGFLRATADLTRKMLAALPSNTELIQHIHRHGLQKI